jgi:hypothetical protein
MAIQTSFSLQQSLDKLLNPMLAAMLLTESLSLEQGFWPTVSLYGF